MEIDRPNPNDTLTLMSRLPDNTHVWRKDGIWNVSGPYGLATSRNLYAALIKACEIDRRQDANFSA